MTDFGSRLKAARKRNQWTQKELAQHLGVEQSTISNYENNFRVPVASALTELADLLQVSVDYLLGRDEETKDPEAAKASGLSTVIEPSSMEVLKDVDLKSIYQEFKSLLLEGHLEAAAERITRETVLALGPFRLFEEVFKPTLLSVGYLWEIGKISVAEEHMISEVIDQLMVTASQASALGVEPPKPYAAVFMLPGAEEHQLPLKMTSMLFKRKGWTTYYLGKSIPLNSLLNFIEQKRVQVLVTSVTLDRHLNSCETLIHALKAGSGKIKPLVVIGGSAITDETYALNQLGADLYCQTLQDLEGCIQGLEQRLEALK